jgi:hypothetical protein
LKIKTLFLFIDWNKGLWQLSASGGFFMDILTFGLTMTIIGMGGTLFSIWLLSLVVDLLKRIFPFRESEDKE